MPNGFPEGPTDMNARKRFTGVNWQSRHQQSCLADCCFFPFPKIDSKHLEAYHSYQMFPSLNHCHLYLRQRSQLQMNRRISWNQTPPNFDDYDPSCLQAQKLGPAPLALVGPVSLELPASGAKPAKGGAASPKVPQVSPTSKASSPKKGGF